MILLEKKFFQSKKIFIAGGSGFIGRNIADALDNNNINYTATFNKKILKKKNFIKCNLLNLDEVIKKTKNYNILIIASIVSSGITAQKKVSEFFLENNYKIFYNLFKSAQLNKIKDVIWISSSTIYPDKKKRKSKEVDGFKDQVHDQYKVIGNTYRIIEILSKVFHDNKKLFIRTIRTGSVYGPYDNFSKKKSHVIPSLIRKMLTKEKRVEVYGDPSISRDFIYVDDLLAAIFKFLKFKDKKPLNFSNGKATSLLELLKSIKKVTGTYNKKIFYNKKKFGQNILLYRKLCNKRSDSILKLKKTSLNEGIKKTVLWYKKKY